MPCASTRRSDCSGSPFGRRPSGGSARRYAVLLLITLVALIASAQTTRNADLDRIRGEITKLKNRLDEVRRQAKTTQQELEEVDLRLGIETRELQIALAAEARLIDEQHRLEDQIALLTPRIEKQKTYLRQRLVALYRLGGTSYLRMFLAIDPRREPINAISMLSYLVSRDARAVSQFQSEQRELALRSADLVDQQRRLQETRRMIEERRRAIAATHQQKRRLLARLRSEESGSAKQLAELEEKATRLERLVEFLSRRQAGGFTGTMDIRSVQGALPWPLEGTVVERFGRQRNEKFATVTTNNGIKVAAAAGTPVHSVFEGTVLFSQWFKGYGNLIIVDHGSRVFSLYGNLKSSAVSVGDRVSAGQPIAGVGEGEDSSAGYLYLEIRRDNRPEDPQKWLR